MIILFNPLNGAEIKNFIIEGRMLDAHPVGKLVQYEDRVAQILQENYGFLEIKTPQEAQELLQKPKEPAFKCDYCEFTSEYSVALAGHMRKHKDEQTKAKEPVVNPELIPVASSKPVLGLEDTHKMSQAMADESELPNGVDQDGVAWYGEGVKEDNRSFAGVRAPGQAHFVGGEL